MTDPDETPDQSAERPDQFDEEDIEDREMRADGGEVVPESVQGTEFQPDGTVTPGNPTHGKSGEDAETPRATERGAGQNSPSPNNWSKESNNSTADDVFSGTASVDDVIDFYFETNPWSVQASTVKSYR